MHATATTDIGAAPTLTAGRRLPARLLRLAGDERLVHQVRAGSGAAFDALYDRHHRGVLAFCRHMVGSVEEAEDAVQHTFMVAYRDLAGTDKPVHLRPWLYAIARNRCLSALRSRREQPLDEAPEPATEHLSAEVQRREDLREILRDLARLPDDQRAALVLAELGDVPHDEISQILGCERGKVKALVFQARSSLHASRAAREAPCTQIREQLANLRGGSLRRNALRRHLRECPGCREFRRHVRSQRRALAVVLPVAPTAGLKEAVIGSALSGGAGAGMLATSGAVSGAGALAAKALVVATVAGGGAAAGTETLRDEPATEPAPARAAAPPTVYSGPPMLPIVTPSASRPPTQAARAEPTARPDRERSLQGVPVQPEGGEDKEDAPEDAAKPAPQAPANPPAVGQHHTTQGPSGTAPSGGGTAPVVGGDHVEPGGGADEPAEPGPTPDPTPPADPDPPPVAEDPPDDVPVPGDGPAEPPPVVGDPTPEPSPDPTPAP